MIPRKRYSEQILNALGRSPIVALLGPRQCGKTTLARSIAGETPSTYFDLESQTDRRKLENPELIFSSLSGLVVMDEIQLLPDLFPALRVTVDKPDNQCRFLILGSASPHVLRNVSESLAGRVEFVDLAGFDISEIGSANWQTLWIRGGFPRSYLAQNEQDSFAWREGFIRTFLQRDIPQLGITISASDMRKFWTMLSHFHGQVWNASRIAASMGVSDKTVRSYLDILTETYMVRQLPPWYENVSKRQVKSPKMYFRDTGLLHTLLGLDNYLSLTGHPQVGASWEGFALEQTLQILRPAQAYFWATYSHAELDLFLIHQGRRYGIEFKFNEAPATSKSMKIALDSLNLDKLFIIYPGKDLYPADKNIIVCPIEKIQEGLSLQ